MNPPTTSHIRFETPGTSALPRVMRSDRTVQRGLGGEQGHAPFPRCVLPHSHSPYVFPFLYGSPGINRSS